MIKLFVCDIDGCLAMPYQPFRLDHLQKVAQRARLAGSIGSHPSIPALSICSGRSYPYVEAMSQLLALVNPVLFESGAGLFDPVKAVSRLHPLFTDDDQYAVDDIRAYMKSLISTGEGLSIDYAKQAQAGMVAKEETSLNEALLKVRAYTDEHHPSFQTFHTHISIDVVPGHLTKAEGMAWLADEYGISTQEMAFIGDTNGDIGAMNAVGRSFAPLNGSADARRAAQHASTLPDVEAVIEAWDLLIEENGS